MDDYQKIWDSFIKEIISKNYDQASEMWDPDTRNVFRKNIKNFRKKYCRWETVEYAGIDENDYIIIRHLHPKGIIAKSIFTFNRYKSDNISTYGKLISFFYNFLKRVRGHGSGYLNSLCGVLLKHFDVAAREYCNEEVIKKYAILNLKNKSFIGWSYAKSIIPKNISHKYEFETFFFLSAIDYSIHIPMLNKLDSYIKNVLKDINVSVPKINIYFHAKLNSPSTGIPKSVFVIPGNNDICIYSIRVKYDTLRHEMLHAIIYAVTSSWPSLFFREGYAESYDNNRNCVSILNNKFPLKFLLNDTLFFDYTEYPPIIAGFLVRYLISQYGIEKFYAVYKKAEFVSTKEILKNEYGLSIKQLKNLAMEQSQQEIDFVE